jgi:probable HAF family extracellular repeat protein
MKLGLGISANAVIACSLILPLSHAHGASLYSVMDLGSLAGPAGTSSAGAINAFGQVTGISAALPSGSPRHAFLWTPGPAGGSMIDLGNTINASAEVYGYAINNSGQVAGEIYAPHGHPFLWSPGLSGGAMVDLGDVNTQGSERDYAAGLNENGSAVGAGFNFSGSGWQSFLWKPQTPNGISGSLFPLGAGELSDINNSGEIAGTGSIAFLWKPTTPNGTVGTRFPLGMLQGRTLSSAAAINDAGQVVGSSGNASSTTNHAFLWTPSTPNGTSGSMIDLGDLPGGGDTSNALAINSFGVVVGNSSVAVLHPGDPDQRAFIWDPVDQMMVDLNTLVASSGAGWTLASATGINDAGQVAGTGYYDPDGVGGSPAVIHAFVLTPVPEPMTSATIGLACLFACHSRMRRRHRSLSTGNRDG